LVRSFTRNPFSSRSRARVENERCVSKLGTLGPGSKLRNPISCSFPISHSSSHSIPSYRQLGSIHSKRSIRHCFYDRKPGKRRYLEMDQSKLSRQLRSIHFKRIVQCFLRREGRKRRHLVWDKLVRNQRNQLNKLHNREQSLKSAIRFIKIWFWAWYFKRYLFAQLSRSHFCENTLFSQGAQPSYFHKLASAPIFICEAASAREALERRGRSQS